jgi:Virulence-associated protein E
MSDLVPYDLPLDFVDIVKQKGGDVVSPTMINTRIAIARLGLDCRYDVLHDRYSVNGSAFGNSAIQVSDRVGRQLREMIRLAFKFDPGKQNCIDALYRACEVRAFHPVLDYLDGCKWDGKPRLDTWLIDYMGVEDNPFTRAVGRLMLIASVRRMRQPGCKFDYMCVLQSPEGKGKSSAISTLYGEEHFSDQAILGLKDDKVAEAVRGRWAMECSELVGMKRGEIELIKSMITRQTDRGRRAWGLAVEDVGRTMVFWGTTNDEQYLRALSGENRRFLSITVGNIDVKAIRRDRDQLWAEADRAEEIEPSLSLPEKLWKFASDARVDRTQIDPWADTLENIADQAKRAQAAYAGSHTVAIYGTGYDNDGNLEERIASAYVLESGLDIAIDKRTPELQKRAGLVMRSLGWSGPKVITVAGRKVRAYVRPDPIEALL